MILKGQHRRDNRWWIAFTRRWFQTTFSSPFSKMKLEQISLTETGLGMIRHVFIASALTICCSAAAAILPPEPIRRGERAAGSRGTPPAIAAVGQQDESQQSFPVPHEIRAAVPTVEVQDDKPVDPVDETDEKPVVETVENTRPINPREIRLHLWDGNVITGELGIEQVLVQTEFGQLQVPIEKITSFRPGLDSFPQKREQIDKLIEDLGAEDYKLRETAHKGLIAMGMQLRREIYRFQDGGNAERKRHLDEIRKEIESMIEDLEEDADLADDDAELIHGDAISTRDFVIVGKIVQDEFEISSKYGPLTVKLMDVKFADRQDGGSVERRATVSISGKNYAHANPKSTGIRLNRGDRVTIRAEGQLTMSPWGVQATVTPEGSTQYGNFNGHGGGTLLAQIGDDDKFIKIGNKATFTASKSGLLKLGIALQAEYANDSYQFPGSYKAKIVVESAELREE